MLALLEGSGDTNAAGQPTVTIQNEPNLFSQQWLDEYHEGNLGCVLGRGSFTWRTSGFGSNINSENLWELSAVMFNGTIVTWRVTLNPQQARTTGRGVPPSPSLPSIEIRALVAQCTAL